MQDKIAIKHAEREKRRRMESEEKRAVQETGQADCGANRPRCEVARTNCRDGPPGSSWG
jgi:hypothetical protein